MTSQLQVNGEPVFRTLLINTTSNELLHISFERGPAEAWERNLSLVPDPLTQNVRRAGIEALPADPVVSVGSDKDPTTASPTLDLATLSFDAPDVCPFSCLFRGAVPCATMDALREYRLRLCLQQRVCGMYA